MATTTTAPPRPTTSSSLAAVDEYQEYVIDQVDELIAINAEFTDAVRAGDVALAQSLFAEARAPWERIEPIAGLVSDIDGAVDARVDDFATKKTRPGPAGTASSTSSSKPTTSPRRHRSPTSSTRTC